MKNVQEVKEILINNTINLIAEGGFEKATTHAITHSGSTPPNIKMNEVYIYRLFGSKENLYSVVFVSLDRDFFLSLRSSIRIGQTAQDIQAELHDIFLKMWKFVLNNEARCRCYIRYYYSIYFKESSLNEHNQLFKELIDDFTPLFKEEADVRSILHSVFTTILDFAIRVYNGDLEDTEKNAEHIFNVVYCMMMTYLKDPVLKTKKISQFI